MWITAALLMQYTPICDSTRSPAIEATLTMRPPVKVPGAAPRLRAIMRLPTSCATKKAPRVLVPIT
jgi:hypothetical protein